MKNVILTACILIPCLGFSQTYSNQGDSKLAISTDTMIKEMMVPSESVKKGFELMDRMGARTSETIPREIQMRRTLSYSTIFPSNSVYILSDPQLEIAAKEMIEASTQGQNQTRTVFADPVSGVKLELSSVHTAASLKVIVSRYAEGVERNSNNEQVKNELFVETKDMVKDIIDSLQNKTGNQRILSLVLDRLSHNNSGVEVFRDTSKSAQEFTVNKAQVEVFLQAENFEKNKVDTIVKSLVENSKLLIEATKAQASNFRAVSRIHRFGSDAHTTREVESSKSGKRNTIINRAIKKGAKK